MDRARRLLFGSLLAVGVVRMVGYLAYAVACLPSPLEVFHLEAKMVLLASRVQAGATLYPEWRAYPHVANFFGPVYFVVVGLLGAATDADIPDLFRIGRGVTFASGLLTTLVLGLVLGGRYGRGAGVAGAVLSLGAAPMFGFSVMVRPDLMAETLGLGGFFLSGHRSRAGRVAAVALLALAVLTKQTAVVFLVAAALASAVEGRWRRAGGVLGGGSALLFALVVAITVLFEPNFAASIAGEAKSPWVVGEWLRTLRRLVETSPDLLLVTAIGVWLWTGRGAGTGDVRWAVLAVVLVGSGLVMSAKYGADLNYFLSLRATESLAIGTLWHARRTAKGRRRSVAISAAAGLALVSLLPGVFHAASQALLARNQAGFLAGPTGQSLLRSYQKAIRLARDPDYRLLTDLGLFDLYQGERAAFGDPWLFRRLVDTGQIEPTVIMSRIDNQYYDLIVTTSDLDSANRASETFGLPKALAVRAGERYAPIRVEAGLFYYGRRRDRDTPRGAGRSPE